MRLDRFKADILNVNRPPLTLPEINKPIDSTFEFSRNKIFFTQAQKKVNLILEPRSDKHAISDFKHGMKYTFDKVYDDNDKIRFQITVGNHNYSSFIRLSWHDKIICNMIHGRYIITREWFYKTIIVAAIGFLFGVIGIMIGYYLKK